MDMKVSECRDYEGAVQFCEKQIAETGDRTGKWRRLADSLGDYVITDIDSRSDKDMAMSDFIMADNCSIGINGIRFIDRNEDECEDIMAMKNSGAWAFPSVPKANRRKYTVYAMQDIITNRIWLCIARLSDYRHNVCTWYPGLRFQTLCQI